MKVFLLCPSMNDKHLQAEWLTALHRSCLLLNSLLDKESKTSNRGKDTCLHHSELELREEAHKEVHKEAHLGRAKERQSHSFWWWYGHRPQEHRPPPLHSRAWARTPAGHAHLRYQPAVGEGAFVSHSGSPEGPLQPCPTAH